MFYIYDAVSKKSQQTASANRVVLNGTSSRIEQGEDLSSSALRRGEKRDASKHMVKTVDAGQRARLDRGDLAKRSVRGATWSANPRALRRAVSERGALLEWLIGGRKTSPLAVREMHRPPAKGHRKKRSAKKA